jgi:hypothetical protein
VGGSGKHDEQSAGPDGPFLPSANFYGLFTTRAGDRALKPCIAEKLRCVLHYFDRVAEHSAPPCSVYAQFMLTT